MFKKLFCKHKYKYLDKEILDTPFPCLEKRVNYIFKCNECKNVITIDNYKVIDKIQKIFLLFLNEELHKSQNHRISNKTLMKKVWNEYSNFDTINKFLHENINVNPVSMGKELSNISDEDILSLKLTIYCAEIKYDWISSELDVNKDYILAKNKKNKYILIDKADFNFDVEKEIKKLKGQYLRHGIKKEIKELEKEALIDVIECNNLLYSSSIKC